VSRGGRREERVVRGGKKRKEEKRTTKEHGKGKASVQDLPWLGDLRWFLVSSE